VSGGSFNYLEHRLGDAWEYRRALKELTDRVDIGGTVVCGDLTALVLAIESVEKLRERLAPIIHAVEWTVSGDWGRAHLEAEVAKYERDHK